MDVRPWKADTIHGPQRRLKRGSDSGDSDRPTKSRIRRSMTACNTCRKLKTRCDLDRCSHACRRCLSLRIECELPETPEQLRDSRSRWPDAGVVSSSIEERLTSLENSMSELTKTVRQVMEASSSRPHSPRSAIIGNDEIDYLTPHDSVRSLKPMSMISGLQHELFGEKSDFAPESDNQTGDDIVAQGLINPNQANRLLQLFVENFGPSVSVYSMSDLPTNIRQSDPFLFTTACLLASRSLPDIPLPVVNAIYHHMRRQSTSILWGSPSLKFSSLQALGLLCLYSATVQTDVVMDSWLLSSLSINHAILSFSFLNQPLSEPIVNDNHLGQYRVWNSLCLAHLQCVISNGRPLNLKRKHLHYCYRILESPHAKLDDGRIVAEIELYYLTLSLQNKHYRTQSIDIGYEELARWRQNWAHILMNEENTAPLNLAFWFCHLLLYRMSLREKPGSDGFITEIVKSARHIVSTFIQLQPRAVVSFIDQVLFIVGYASLTLCEYDIANPIIDQVQFQFIHIAHNEKHMAYRFAYVMSELKQRSTKMNHSHPTPPYHPMDAPVALNPPIASLLLQSSIVDPMFDRSGPVDQLLTRFMSVGVDSTVATPVYEPISTIPLSNCGLISPVTVQHPHRPYQSPPSE
ncbi:C6 zinc finger domain protein [Talaromyces proteolyticus]|uniref:Transcriptional activator of proteases prtT n=1 Tax=Talaromyces proteolyticus TaxID=1131652 RepID=A0AAD4L242_9EURO|nr:C6 zinc finger domain protein [Talaromyces proteolyticus]KAH8704145.1 C6 zinc finger domain protein [Talaromyces proteolyticus]